MRPSINQRFWVAATLTLGLANAALAADVATIKVSVTGQDGKPAAGVPVRLLLPPGVTPPSAEKKPAAAADKPAEKKPETPAAGDGKPTKLQEATTDEKGEATFEKVAPGDYILNAGNRDAGLGRQKLSLKAGETATVAITLKAPKAK
jgi:hypothetical protein